MGKIDDSLILAWGCFSKVVKQICGSCDRNSNSDDFFV